MFIKFLTQLNSSPFQYFDYTPYLPIEGRPGVWLKPAKNAILCREGYHVCRPEDASEWLDDNLYEVEISGLIVQGDNKIACTEMRFIRKITHWHSMNIVKFIARFLLNYYRTDHYSRIYLRRLFTSAYKVTEGLYGKDDIKYFYQLFQPDAVGPTREIALLLYKRTPIMALTLLIDGFTPFPIKEERKLSLDWQTELGNFIETGQFLPDKIDLSNFR